MTSSTNTLRNAVSGERALNIAAELVAIDSRNPPGDTLAIADYVEAFLADLGLEPTLHVTDPIKPNLIATIQGETDRTLCYNGHLDTVPFDATEWSTDPLGTRVDDRLYGRGATDMKGPLASMLHVAETIVDQAVVPPVTLAFVVVSDEETGGTAGVQAMLEQGVFDDFVPDACVIGETTCSGGQHSVTVADRGSIWLTLAAAGTAAHGSRPVLGDNAIDRLLAAVDTIRDRLPARRLQVPNKLAAVIDESVAYYTPSMGKTAARDLFEHPTVNLGTINGGESVNTVPRTATAELDVRVTAGIDTSTILADVRDCLDGHDHVSIADVSWSNGTFEPVPSPLVDAVTETAAAVSGDRVYRRSATGGGDAKNLRTAGIPTVEFAFGTDTVHGVDEYTTRAALEANAIVYATVPAVWARALQTDSASSKK